jgi:PAS domain S-box-containing protein
VKAVVVGRLAKLSITRITAVFALLTLVPLLLLAFSSVRLSTDAVQMQVNARLRGAASNGAAYVGSEMKSLSELVTSYAGRPNLRQALESGPGAHATRTIAYNLRQLRSSRRGIATTFITDPSGRLIDVRPKTAGIVGRDFSSRDWYQGVTAMAGPYVSDAYRTAARGHLLVVAAASPVRAVLANGGQGKTVALLVAAYDLNTIGTLSQSFLSRDGLALTVTDRRGTVIAGPRSATSSVVSDKDALPVGAALAGRSGVVEAARKNEPVTAYAPVPGIGWAATVEIPGHAANAAGSRLRFTVLAISALLAIVLSAALILLVLTLRERRRIEERLRISEGTARSIIDAAGQAFISMDEGGLLTGWNRRAEDTFGWTREEVIGRPTSEVIRISYADETGERSLPDLFADSSTALKDRRFDVIAHHRDGRSFPASVTSWSVVVEDRRSFSAFVEDITERRAAEYEIRVAQQAAEEASLAKSDFLSRVSHELRTPLNAILGFGQLLEMDKLGPEQQESVHEIVRGGRHLLELINEVLDISRIETGQLSLSLEPVLLDHLVGESMSLVTPLAGQRSIVLDHVAAREGIHVAADRQRLKQVLLNLLSNAIKYNIDGGIVTVRSREVDAKIEVTVTDTGLGIAPARLQRLFTPFDRLGAERTEVEGTGLGLSLTKSLVEAMGGELRVVSEVGRGTTFCLQLPPADDPGASEPLAAVTAEDHAGRTLRTILYIEDNLSNVKLIGRALKRRPDVQLVTAVQGSIGIELARAHRPDLILLDLHLPDTTGAEVLNELRRDPRTATIPVVIVSADATSGQIERLLVEGADAYITKPIELATLFTTIDSFISEVQPERVS